jgi:dTDP-4-dehydrorhamnose 3,5-epimerase
MYLCSTEYSPQREHTIAATDPALAIDWPSGHGLVLSDRDAAAPTLDEVRAAGLLPTLQETQAFIQGLRDT